MKQDIMGGWLSREEFAIPEGSDYIYRVSYRDTQQYHASVVKVGQGSEVSLGIFKTNELAKRACSDYEEQRRIDDENGDFEL